jgi:methionyl-tRNA synthetase
VSGALEDIWSAVRALNRFVQDREPWKLAKEEGHSAELDQVLYGAAEGLRVVSVLLHPYMPDTAEKLLAVLGREDRSLDGARYGTVGGGARIGEPGQLFPKIEGSQSSAA